MLQLQWGVCYSNNGEYVAVMREVCYSNEGICYSNEVMSQ
jgi:hypothetical protein